MMTYVAYTWRDEDREGAGNAFLDFKIRISSDIRRANLEIKDLPENRNRRDFCCVITFWKELEG